MSNDFFAELDDVDGGKREKGYKPRFDDPIEAARFNFVKAGTLQIQLIENDEGKANSKGNLCGNWFEREANGRYKITLKNGIVAIEIKGKTYFYLANKQAACEFIAKAVKSAETGGFDDYFKATARKVKAKDDKVAPSVVDKYVPGANGDAGAPAH